MNTPIEQKSFFLKHRNADTDTLGPFRYDELKYLAKSGNITIDALICAENEETWVRIANTPLVFELPLNVEDPDF